MSLLPPTCSFTRSHEVTCQCTCKKKKQYPIVQPMRGIPSKPITKYKVSIDGIVVRKDLTFDYDPEIFENYKESNEKIFYSTGEIQDFVNIYFEEKAAKYYDVSLGHFTAYLPMKRTDMKLLRVEEI